MLKTVYCDFENILWYNCNSVWYSLHVIEIVKEMKYD